MESRRIGWQWNLRGRNTPGRFVWDVVKVILAPRPR